MRKPLPLLSHARELLGSEYGARLPLFASAGARQHLRKDLLDALPEGFSELSSGARREAVAGWAIQLVADHGASEANRRIAVHLNRTAAAVQHDRDRVERDRQSTRAQVRTAEAPRHVTAASSYVVPCATGCGHWLAAAGPRPVVARSSACDRPAGAARRANRAERRRERNA